MKSLAEQIACVKRELALRRNVYPGWVRNGKMSKAKADHEIECMADVLATVEKVATHEILP